MSGVSKLLLRRAARPLAIAAVLAAFAGPVAAIDSPPEGFSCVWSSGGWLCGPAVEPPEDAGGEDDAAASESAAAAADTAAAEETAAAQEDTLAAAAGGNAGRSAQAAAPTAPPVFVLPDTATAP